MTKLNYVHTDERRLTVQLVQYWNQLRGEDEIPKEEQLDPDELEGIWERCFLVQVRDMEHVKDYNYSHFGPELRAAYEAGLLEEGNARIAGSEATLLEPAYREVIEEAGPIIQEDEYIDSIGRNVKYRQILMPFGQKDGTVESILGGSWFKLD